MDSIISNKDLIIFMRAKYVDNGRQGTHAPDCHRWHPPCAIALLCDRLEDTIEEIAIPKDYEDEEYGV